MIPDLDLQRIRRWAAARVSEDLREEIRIEFDVTDRAVTILECRPPWDPEYGPEWTRLPVARLRYTKSRGEWSLYWSDRHLKFHEYDRVQPSTSVTDLLDEIDADPTCIFWG